MEIIIIEAEAQHIGDIKEFQLAMALETEGLKLDGDILEKGIEAVINDSSRARYFIAKVGEKIAGMLMITTEWSDWRNGWVWWIQSVYVAPEYRNRGVYSSLYSFIKEEVSRREDVRGLRLYVDKRNAKAQAVYQKLGMNGDHYTTYEWMGDE